MHKKLKKQAKKKGMEKGSKQYKKYVYGTMQKKTDWKPKK